MSKVIRPTKASTVAGYLVRKLRSETASRDAIIEECAKVIKSEQAKYRNDTFEKSIEVTEEMIEAGVSALSTWKGESDYVSERQAVVEIYQAMRLAATSFGRTFEAAAIRGALEHAMNAILALKNAAPEKK